MNTYSTGEFSDLIGVSIKMLQRWDREGILVADRTPIIGNYRKALEKALADDKSAQDTP